MHVDMYEIHACSVLHTYKHSNCNGTREYYNNLRVRHLNIISDKHYE